MTTLDFTTPTYANIRTAYLRRAESYMRQTRRELPLPTDPEIIEADVPPRLQDWAGGRYSGRVDHDGQVLAYWTEDRNGEIRIRLA